MKLELSELMRQHTSLINEKSEMQTLLTNVDRVLDDICNNVKSTSLVQANQNLKDNMARICNSLDAQLTNLSEFMESQINSYRVTNEDATVALRSLVDSINGLYGGSTVSEVAGGVASGSARAVVGGAVGSVGEEVGEVVSSLAGSDSSEVTADVSGAVVGDGASSSTESSVANYSQTSVVSSVISDNSAYSSGEGNVDWMISYKDFNNPTYRSRAQETYSFLKGQGYSDEQCAGIMGCITQESGWEIGGAGLCQWTYTPRRPNDMSFQGQLNHLNTELHSTNFSEYGPTKPYVQQFNNATTVKDAVNGFNAGWEQFGKAASENKVKFAESIYYLIKSGQL